MILLSARGILTAQRNGQQGLGEAEQGEARGPAPGDKQVEVWLYAEGHSAGEKLGK